MPASLNSDKENTSASHIMQYLSYNKNFSLLTQIFEGAKSAAFHTFYKISTKRYNNRQKLNSQKISLVLYNLIITLQAMSFLWHWNLGVSGWENYRTFWRVVGYGCFDKLCAEFQVFDLCMYTAVALSMVTCGGIIGFGVLMHRNREVPGLMEFALEKLVAIVGGIGFIPIANLCVVGIKHSLSSDSTIKDYYNMEVKIEFFQGVLLCISLVFVLILYFLYHSLTAEMRHSFAKKNIGAKSTTAFQIKEGAVFFCIILANSFVAEDSVFLLYGITLALSLYMFLQYLTRLPHYLLFTNCAKASVYYILGIEAVIFAVGYIQDNAFVFLLLSFIVTPLLLAPLYSLFCYRESKVVSPKWSKLYQLRTVYDMELCVREAMKKSTQEERERLIYCFGKCFDKSNFRGEKMLYVWTAHLCLYSIKDSRLARIKIWKCLDCEGDFESDFQEFCSKKALEAESKDCDDLEFMKFLVKQTEVTQIDKSLCYHLLTFWNELLSRFPRLSVLRNQSSIISEDIEKIEKIYEKLIENHQEYTDIFKMYSSFLNDILYDSEKALQITRRGDVINSYNDISLFSSTKLKFFDSENGVILISGSPSAFGVIVYANNKAAELLGASVTDLMKSEFTNFIVPPYNKVHDQNIKRFLTYCSNPTLRIPINFIVQNPKGYIAEIFIRTQVIAADGYPIISLIVRDPDFGREAALIDNQGNISSHTELFSRQLGLETDIFGHNILDYVPELDLEAEVESYPVFRQIEDKEIAILPGNLPVGRTCIKLVWVIWRREEIKVLKKVQLEKSTSFYNVKKGDLMVQLSSASFNERPKGMTVKFAEERKQTINDSVLAADSYLGKTQSLLSDNLEQQRLQDSPRGSSVSGSTSTEVVFGKSKVAENLFGNAKRAIWVFKWILFLSIIAVLSSYSVMIYYVETAVSQAQDFESAKNFNEVKIKIAETAHFARIADIYQRWSWNTYLEETYARINNNALVLNDYLKLNFASQWGNCPAAQVFTENTVEIWENYRSPRLEFMNLIDASSAYSQAALSFQNRDYQSMNYYNDLYFLTINGIGPMFKKVNSTLNNYIECDSDSVDQLDTNMNLLLFVITGILIMCFCVLVPNSIGINKKFSQLWNEMRKLGGNSYVELRQTALLRLSDVHGELDLNVDECEGINFKKKEAKQVNLGYVRSYIYRLLIFVVISIAFYFVSYFVFYGQCKYYLKNRPFYMQQLKSLRNSLIETHFWAVEAYLDSQPEDLKHFLKDSYLFEDPKVELEKVIVNLDNSMENFHREYVRAQTGEQTISELYEKLEDFASPKLSKGLYQAYLTMIDDYRNLVANRKNLGIEVLFGMFEEVEEIMNRSELVFETANDESKALIKTQLNWMIWFTVLYGVTCLCLFFFLYLPFLDSERKRLEIMRDIGQLIPLQAQGTTKFSGSAETNIKA